MLLFAMSLAILHSVFKVLELTDSMLSWYENIMKLNCSTQIISENVVLVPYRKEHVPKYHNWMEDEGLREQTASERLTLEEEYAMQQTWLHDENKCTFIALDKDTLRKTNDESESMIGDANLYLNYNQNGEGVGQLTGEIGLMVAEPRFRGRGFGKEIALCLIRYGIQSIRIKRFQAVISMKNEISIKMFENLGFVKVSVSEVFEEVTLSRIVDDGFIKFIEKSTAHFQERSTRPNE